MRFRLPGGRTIAELTMRHWSNGGLRLPNHGQDFATLTVKLNTGRFGVGASEQIPVAGLLSHDLVANVQAGAEELP